MLRSLENLEFIESEADGLKIQMCPQGKMVKMVFDFQTLKFEKSKKSSEDMIILSNNTADGCFAQSSILFERFVEDFYRPSSLIGR